jgi:ABC-type Mn2+/Zn2+ transport system permease subunit
MLLAGDVISHLALPGLGLALLFKLNPLLGAATSLFVGTILIWRIQQRTALATENIVGVVFAAALGIGAAVTPSEDLIGALFGSFQFLSLSSFLVGLVGVGVVVVCVWLLKEQLILSLFSSDLAAATGVKVGRGDLYFLLLFSLTVLIGLRFFGALLAASLIIIPAAVGHQLTSNMRHFLAASCIVSAVSVSLGLLLSTSVFPRFEFGPMTVVVSAAFFVTSLLKKTAFMP